MKVVFEYTLEDLLEVQLRNSKSKIDASWNWEKMILPALLCGLPAVVLFPVAGYFTLIMFLLIMLLMCWVFVDSWERLMREKMSNRLESLFSRGPRTCEVEIMDEGVSFADDEWETLHSWNRIGELRPLGEDLELVDAKMRTVGIIRNRAFASPEERKKFASEIAGHLGRGTAAKAT